MKKHDHFTNAVFSLNNLEWADSDEFLALVEWLMRHNGIVWYAIEDVKDALMEVILEERAPARGLSALAYAEMVADICYDDEMYRMFSRYDTSREAFADACNFKNCDLKTVKNLCDALMKFPD